MQTTPFQFGRRPYHSFAPGAHQASRFIDDPILAILKIAIYTMFLGTVIDGFFPQIAMALLGGRDPYLQPLLKLALPSGCAFLWLIKGRLNLNTVGLPGVLFLLYLVFDTIYIGLSSSFASAALGLYVGYFTFFMMLIVTALDTSLSEVAIARMLLAAFAVNLLLELAQVVTNSPILPLESSDGNFAVTSFQFYGNIRAFGLFGSISAAGSFGSLIAALAIGNWRQRWSALTTLSVAATCLLMVYLVHLRLGFIELALSVLAALLLRFAPLHRSTLFLPVIELITMLLLLFGLNAVLGHSASFLDASSLIERLGEWRDALATLNDLSWSKILFGTGMIQHRLTVSHDNGTWLDSMYLEVSLHVGIIGLILLLAYYGWLYRYAVRWVQRTGSPLAIAVAAVWSSLPALGVINLMYANLSTYLIGLLLCAAAPSALARPLRQQRG